MDPPTPKTVRETSVQISETKACCLLNQQAVAEGNGPIAAFVHALRDAGEPAFEVTNFKQHALSSGSEASAIAYIQIKDAAGKTRWGAGVDTNIELASIKAVLSAVNRAK